MPDSHPQLTTLDDTAMMAHALRLAERGLFTTMPNPRVGCVIVKNGKVVGEGAHLKAGEPHAEVYALRQAGEHARGATAYVTLEPCSHFGRTPPCADALINAGISRVVVAMQDPNPQVAGQGIARLQAQHIQVSVGVLQAQAQALNQGFIRRMSAQMPYVRSKIAASLDGKTALQNGQSQWITSPAARQDVQRWRAQSCAILTGVGTVLADNPQMLVRELDIGRQPLRVVVDSHLRTPVNANILQGGNVLIACAVVSDARLRELQQAGAEILLLPDATATESPRVCLNTLLQTLAQRQINEVLVEAGSQLNGALLDAGLVDALILYYAPKLMGHTAQGMFAMPPLTAMSATIALNISDMRMVGNDIRLIAQPQCP